MNILEAYEHCGGNVAAIARHFGIPRSTAWSRIKVAGLKNKLLVEGTSYGTKVEKWPLPVDHTQCYIITSAQNNTHINKPLWANLLALAEYYSAKILIGTFSYDQNRYGKHEVKVGTKKHTGGLWFDSEITPYICDKRIELANGLVWCGELNIIPTAKDPLSGLETYSGRKSAIFPHAKIAMRSIASMEGDGAKLNYTTGTITKQNYIAKKAGLIAEHNHSYGAILVEVNSDGNWWVRQLEADKKGRICDLDIMVDKGKVTCGNRVEAITWGDLHATAINAEVKLLAHDMQSFLRPKYQFIHDLLEGVSVNHHGMKNIHDRFEAFQRGLTNVEAELYVTSKVLKEYAAAKDCKTVVVDSNHDGWLKRWLREHDYREDPMNAFFFLEAQLEVMKAIRRNDKKFNLIEWVVERHMPIPSKAIYLNADESFLIANNTIECGMHGHLGPNGARGTTLNLSKVGRKSNIAHTHVAEIRNGLYCAGVSAELNQSYNSGPSSWTHTHIVTYKNGRRSLITIFNGKWRA